MLDLSIGQGRQLQRQT